MTGTIFFIFVFATTFSIFLATSQLPYKLTEWITRLGLPPYAIISLILFIYTILGCLMNALPAVILTLPIFFPIAMAAGFDPVWFGVPNSSYGGNGDDNSSYRYECIRYGYDC